MFFGANIKYLRTLRGMSQAQLGLHMNVTPSTIAGWESGKSSPHFDVLLRLRELFQVDLDSLVYRDLHKDASGEKKVERLGAEDGIVQLVQMLFGQLEKKIDGLEGRIQKIESKA